MVKVFITMDNPISLIVIINNGDMKMSTKKDAHKWIQVPRKVQYPTQVMGHIKVDNNQILKVLGQVDYHNMQFKIGIWFDWLSKKESEKEIESHQHLKVFLH